MAIGGREDFEDVRRQWDAFWRGENQRPAVIMTAPVEGVEPAPKPAYAAGHDGNFGPVIDQVLRWAESNQFLGDALPFYYIEFGADQFATFLGADLTFPDEEQGGWATTTLEGVELKDAEIRFQPESKWWERVTAFIEEFRRRCGDEVLCASPTLVANLDALVALRGANNVLVDLVMDPDGVHHCLEQIARAHLEILDALAEVLDYERLGSITRHGFYSSGRINVPQCDFSCMISPEMFDEFVAPYLQREFDAYDGGEYHLDGPDAIQHLESLARIDGLQVIQWVAGAGNEGQDWSGLFQKIDDLGLGQLRGARPQDALALWQRLKTRHLVLNVRAASRDEGLRLLDEFERAEK